MHIKLHSNTTDMLKNFYKVLSNSPQYVIHSNHTCGVWAQAVHCQNGQTWAFSTWCDFAGLTGKPLQEHSGWL